MHPLFDLAPLAVAAFAAAMVLPAAFRELPRALRTRAWDSAGWQALAVVVLAAAVLTPTARLATWAAETAVSRALLAALGTI